MRKALPLSLLGLGLGFCGACATLGTAFQFSGPSDIAVGKTTKGTLLAQFGRPARVGYDNGSEKWAYAYYHYSVFGASTVKDLDIVLDKNGVVTSYTYESSDPGEIAKQLPAGVPSTPAIQTPPR